MPEDDVAPWLLRGTDVYRAFTDDCNARSPVVMLSSGQACVWYRLAIASKDGDWLVRETDVALATVRDRLARCGACYRLGAPLDRRWLAAGWSSHFEALGADGARLRFDFVSRPPRIEAADLAEMWSRVDAGGLAVVPRRELIALKRTMRLKDYAFIGGLSLQLDDPADQIRSTIDAEHLLALLSSHPLLAARLPELRPSCVGVSATSEGLAAAIDAEIRRSRAADEARIRAYATAIGPWAERFRSLDQACTTRPLEEAHALLCAAAVGCLPEAPPPWP